MKLKDKHLHKFRCMLLLFMIGFLTYKMFIQREGVTFTRYDNKKFFTKPWDQFCIPTAPTCQKEFLEKPGMIGIFPIGCNCESTGISKSPPGIDRSCYLDQTYYYK